MIDTQLEGASRIRDCYQETGALGKASYAKALFWMGATIQESASGSQITNACGQTYLDVLDSYGNQTFGFRHPRLLEKAQQELSSGLLHNCKLLFSEKSLELSKNFSRLTGGQLPHTFLCNGGAEAIDTALKLARGYTGRPNFVSARNSYHGMTFAALSSAHRPEFEALYHPMFPSFVPVDFGNIEQLRSVVDNNTAAILLETIQAEGGIVLPPKDYYRQVRELCDETGALLILDEIQTAFGRTGRFFAFENFDILPDLVCIGKSLGGGMVPISAVLSSQKCWEVMGRAPFSFASSLAGAPLASAIAHEAIEIALEDDWLTSVREKAEIVEELLIELSGEYPDLIEAFRGIGLLWGLQLRSPILAGYLCWLLSKQGLLTSFSLFEPATIRIQPPLVISKDELQTVGDAFRAALREARAFLKDHGLEGHLFSAELSIPTDLSIREAQELVASPEALYDLMNIRAQRLSEQEFQCAALWEGLYLKWIDFVDCDAGSKQSVKSGDWENFDRHWTVREKGQQSEIVCAMTWNAGCGALEPMVALRVRQLLVEAFELASRK